MAEMLRMAQRVIDLADGDPTKGNLIVGSPLAIAIMMRGVATMPVWVSPDGGRTSTKPSRWPERRPACFAMAVMLSSTSAVGCGVILTDDAALREISGGTASSPSDPVTTPLGRRPVALVASALVHGGRLRSVRAGFDLLAKVREAYVRWRIMFSARSATWPTAKSPEKGADGDLAAPLSGSRAVVDDVFAR